MAQGVSRLQPGSSVRPRDQDISLEENHENSLVQMLVGDGMTSYAAGDMQAYNQIEDIDPLDFDRDFAKIAGNLLEIHAKANHEQQEARTRRQEVMTCMTNHSGDVDDSVDGDDGLDEDSSDLDRATN